MRKQVVLIMMNTDMDNLRNLLYPGNFILYQIKYDMKTSNNYFK